MPKLVIHNLKTQEEQEYDIPQDNILLGRTNTCDVELPVKSVSRRHAEITRENQDYFLSDLGSGNGTFLNNKKVTPQEKNLLRSGDQIRVEDYEIRFLLTDESSAPTFEEDTDTDILEIKLIKKMMKALDSEDIPSLEVLNGSTAGKRVFLADDKQEFFIGRGDDCDLCIPENVLSRNHVKLERKWGGIVITDLGSKNGTFINNEPIQEKLLHDGDRIMLGTIKLLYRNPKEIKVQIAHQELNRKKKEAALQQAEALAKKQLEEEKRQQEAAEQAKVKQEAEAREVEATLEEPATETNEGTAAAETAPEESIAEPPSQADEAAPEPFPQAPESPPETLEAPAGLEKPKFSNIEKIFIALGILVGIIAIVGIIALLM